ncbi:MULTISPECIES: ComEC/Rec2 family competence protein [unclassified Ruminococcus]|uniref:ComEC/Rec2 family competence protein n=1 Tax=unclassified Ruminococcus TaxID=2608920 RepID=UPI00210EE0FE|nr:MULTISPECIES: MBL fold metallo-hydrolase [unclassified Ruminococcus]MCQ4022172.1 MBL fold metallo-hydrolase [Ruminococcus sp. zg-924]MCQ4115570.1 MBL fold metallo-hydrolase [Ruminococcus sp. zg-921]
MADRKDKRIPNAVRLIIVIAVAASIMITALNGWSGVYQLVGLRDNIDSKNSLTASFFSVGCGDCCIISSAGKHILIDAGESSSKDSALHYIHQNGIDRIDLAVITHFDSDHCNNFLNILNEIKVDRLVTSYAFDGDDSGTGIIAAALKSGVAVEYMGAGDKTEVGNVGITVLSPSEIYSAENDNSLVLRLEAFGRSMLFMADCGTKAEQDIVNSCDNLKCDILKVSHHGSGKNTGEEFLQRAMPEYAVVSVGINSYGLPSVETISRLEASGARVLRTDKSGKVSFEISEKEIKVKTDY